MKRDEKWFLRLVQAGVGLPPYRGTWPRDIINGPGCPVHPKRALYLLEKWTRKGWYEYGVTVDLGWMTEKGMAVQT